MRSAFFAWVLMVASCGGGEAPAGDAGGLDAAPRCSGDLDCDDGEFCNGSERCAAGACSEGAAPCAAGEVCDEATDRCTADPCPAGSDLDGDGRRAIACGGDDCDDTSPLRYPGAAEICDAMHRDEDCDPATLGFRDLDGDAHPDARCCNEQPDGALRCGDDCDDMRPDRYPGLVEACDAVDNDCDGTLDEGAHRTFVIDADGDGYGSSDPGADTRTGCTPPAGFVELATDCDDGDPATHPGATELCTPANENCDPTGAGYDTRTCIPGATRSCSACDLVAEQSCADYCEWPERCMAGAITVVYDALDPRLMHQCGYACDASGGAGSPYWCSSGDCWPGDRWPQWGPPVALPMGTYRVEFEGLARSGGGPRDVNARIVRASDMAELARGDAPTPSGSHGAFTIVLGFDVTVSTCTGVHLVVQGSDVRIRQTRLHRL